METTTLQPLSYNQRDAAKVLGVSPRTLQRWTAAGVVQVSIINGVQVYARTELERLVNSNQQQKAG